MIQFSEWYGSANGGNVGIKMPSTEMAKEIAAREDRAGVRPSIQVMDPSAFKQDGGPSQAERMAEATDGKVFSRRADNKRVGVNGAIGGWDVMRERINGIVDGEFRTPLYYVMDNCVHTVRTLPMLQHDPDNPEDLYGTEDHLADAIRYGVMSRPWENPAPEKPPKPRDIYEMTLDELWAENKRVRASNEFVRI
jgi:hypothetical protein